MVKKVVKITMQRLVDALVWNCPQYTRDGAFSACNNGDGTKSNCVKEKCSHVHNIFRTMADIQEGKIVVY